MRLAVFINGKYVVTETNLDYARHYWAQRQALRPEVQIKLIELPAPEVNSDA